MATVSQLVQSFEQAAEQARHQAEQAGHPVLLSWVEPWSGPSAEALWRGLQQAGHRTLPSLLCQDCPPPFAPGPQGFSCVRFRRGCGPRGAGWLELLGLGSAAGLCGRGSARFAQVRQLWETLRQRSVQCPSVPQAPMPRLPTGPTVVGGFAFQPSASRQGGWEAFGDAWLWVPRIWLCSSRRASALTVNLWVDAGSDPALLRAVRDKAVAWLHQVGAGAQPAGDLVGGGGTEANGPAASRHAWPRSAAKLDATSLGQWMDKAALAVQAIREGRVEKVVLAGQVELVSAAGWDMVELWRQLTHAAPRGLAFALGLAGGACEAGTDGSDAAVTWFVGATPERLVQVRDGMLASGALAGSVPVADRDAAATASLVADARLRHEHEVVVRAVEEALQGLCGRVRRPPGPRMVAAGPVQHLFTPIYGWLRQGVTVWDAVERLHPTPAVGGYPTAGALAWLDEHEGFDRGWYGGPVGWVDARGDGEFWVAIRCSLLTGRRARLFAGCGIVGQSRPEMERQELHLKLQVMGQALQAAAAGGAERGGMVG